MKHTKTIKRVLLLALSLLLLVGVFSSCGKVQIDTKWTAADTDAVTYFARILPLGDALADENGITPREKFIAASRGYNMSAADFDDSKVELGVVKDVDVEAAKAALALVKPADDASVLKFDEFCNSLGAEEIKQIVVRMGTEVDLTQKSNPMVWIGTFLGWLTNITGGNYVVALFFFALIVEILLLYFGIRQQKDSIKRAKLAPREHAIRKKYAGRKDQKSMQAMNQEIQQMYQEAGASPFSGCLPLLIQMPIVIILYNIVVDPLRYVLGKAEGLSAALSTYATTSRAAGGLGETLSANRGTIELLSKLTPENLSGLKNFGYYSNASACYDGLSDVLGGNIPNFNLFGLNMGLTPGFHKPYLLLLIPVLTFAAYFASMKLTRKFSYQPNVQDPQMGCSNNMMDITMPLMSVYITFITPAAIGIYWIFKCIIGVLKQFILHKAMPLPTFTEEDYKRAEKEMKGKARAGGYREPVQSSGPRRSLHHIDDDEDDLPPRIRESGEEKDYIPAEKRRSPEQQQQKEEATGEKKETLLNGAPLKEDRKNNKKK